MRPILERMVSMTVGLGAPRSGAKLSLARSKFALESVRKALHVTGRQMIDARRGTPATAGREATAEFVRRNLRVARHAQTHDIAAGLRRQDRDGAARVGLRQIVGERADDAARPGFIR